jgi:hypothetical protein
VIYHNDDLYQGAMGEDPLRLLDFVYDTYSARKPIHISEYGVTHYTTTDDKYYNDYATRKLTRLYGNLLDRYPRVKAITYFNVNNVNETNDVYQYRRINNYAITTEEELISTYSGLIQDERYLSEIQQAAGNHPEQLSFNYRYFIHDSNLYVDLDFYTNNLDLNLIARRDGSATLSNGDISITVPVISRYKKRTFYDMHYDVHGIPLRMVADRFGYQILIDYQTKSIILQ